MGHFGRRAVAVQQVRGAAKGDLAGGGAARLFDFAVDLTRRRKAAGHAGRLTLIDKSNVLKSMAFFREVFDQRLAPMAISAVTMSMSTPPPSPWCARLGIMT